MVEADRGSGSSFSQWTTIMARIRRQELASASICGQETFSVALELAQLTGRFFVRAAFPPRSAMRYLALMVVHRLHRPPICSTVMTKGFGNPPTPVDEGAISWPAVIRTIDFHGWKVLHIVGEPLALRRTIRVEHAVPMVVAPRWLAFQRQRGGEGWAVDHTPGGHRRQDRCRATWHIRVFDDLVLPYIPL